MFRSTVRISEPTIRDRLFWGGVSVLTINDGAVLTTISDAWPRVRGHVGVQLVEEPDGGLFFIHTQSMGTGYAG